MPYKIVILQVALDQLAALPETDQRRITEQTGLLATNPRPRSAQRLQDHPSIFRLRLGHYRIIYILDDERSEVLIVKIARRREGYPL